jgi:hypothetical protein
MREMQAQEKYLSFVAGLSAAYGVIRGVGIFEHQGIPPCTFASLLWRPQPSPQPLRYPMPILKAPR